MIFRYEQEVRELLREPERVLEVRAWRVDGDGSWRDLGERCQERWGIDLGRGDAQSLGATLWHIAAEILGENPDKEPWN